MEDLLSAKILMLVVQVLKRIIYKNNMNFRISKTLNKLKYKALWMMPVEPTHNH